MLVIRLLKTKSVNNFSIVVCKDSLRLEKLGSFSQLSDGSFVFRLDMDRFQHYYAQGIPFKFPSKFSSVASRFLKTSTFLSSSN